MRSRHGPTTAQRKPVRDEATGELRYPIRCMLLLSGVSERTFAKWRKAGAVSPPKGRTRAALYGERAALQTLAVTNRKGKRIPSQAEILAHVIEVLAGGRKQAVVIGRGVSLVLDREFVMSDARGAAFLEAVVHSFDRIYGRRKSTSRTAR